MALRYAAFKVCILFPCFCPYGQVTRERFLFSFNSCPPPYSKVLQGDFRIILRHILCQSQVVILIMHPIFLCNFSVEIPVIEFAILHVLGTSG